MIIKVTDHTSRCLTGSDGHKIFKVIRPLMDQGRTVVVSFKGIDAVSPTFINTAFIDLLIHFDFDLIKAYLSFSDTYKHINDLIKKRFAFETH
jgi:hypothetical protein